jgi:hypothetical protein
MYFEDVPLSGFMGMVKTTFNSDNPNLIYARTRRTMTLSTGVTTLYPDGQKPRVVLEKLEAMLQQDNTACLNLIRELRVIPGSGELIHEMEDFYFGCALVILGELKRAINKKDMAWIPREETIY